MLRSSILTLCFFPLYLFAQSFADDGNYWVLSSKSFINAIYPMYLETAGDTLISDTLYQKVFISEDFYPEPTYIGAIRQEGSQVFVVPTDPSTPYSFLIYDWSMAPGDTISNSLSNWVTVDSISNITLNNGTEKRLFACTETRVNFNADTFRFQRTIIEDIGVIDSDFMLNPFSNLSENSFAFPFSYPFDVRCFSHQEELLWQHPAFQECDKIIVEVTSPLDNQSLTLYPNPVYSELHVSWNSTSPPNGLSLQIFDTYGRLLYKTTIDGLSSNFTIDVSELQAGMYILQCLPKDDPKGTISQKFFKY